MNLPKVKISVATLDETFPSLHAFLSRREGQQNGSDSIYRYYPELKSKVQDIQDAEKRKEIEYLFFTEVFEMEKKVLEKKAKIFKIEDNLYLAASGIASDIQVLVRKARVFVSARFLKIGCIIRLWDYLTGWVVVRRTINVLRRPLSKIKLLGM